jgi:hypothetical protein
MSKKSLFFGAAALALLVLFAFAGCSNPASESTQYVSQAGSDYPYPADTVFVDSWDSLIGLLNDYNADTNRVLNIAYQGASASFVEPLIIPTGKTVYLTDDHAGIAQNITVREGAKLVLVGDFAVNNGNALLVRGTVEVFKSLTVAVNALDVADYTVENVMETGRNTVIGTHVTILPGAVLTLDVTDLIPPTESLPNKFTPQQAWAAAGQGHLVIGTGGSVPGTPDIADVLPNYFYTVEELLRGVSPSASRTYTVTSGRYSAEDLPAVIPAGAYILTRAIPSRSVSDTFIVNGSLSTQGTLNGISKIEIGNGGALTLTEPNGEVLRGLTDLRLGPGAALTVTSDDASLENLSAIFLGDGSSIVVPGNGVTFKEDTPLALTLGKNITYQVGTSVAATVNTVISKDASLVGGSNLIVYEGSTFTVDPGVTFTVGGGSTLDISRVLAAETPAITINGVLNIVPTGTLIAPASGDAAVTDIENFYATVALGADGKVLLNHGVIGAPGAEFFFGATQVTGAAADTPIYTWSALAATSDGAQIELNSQGQIIRDTNDTSSAVTVTIGAPGAVILKDKSLTLEREVTLATGITAGTELTLRGDTDANGGGAKLLGPGVVSAGTTAFKGGDYGWQAVGADNIVFGASGAAAGTLTALDSATPPVAAANPVLLTALGAGATINGPASSNLTIGANTTIALDGVYTKKKGEITLAGAATAGKITLLATGVITTGNTPSGTTLPLAVGGVTLANGAGTDVIGILNLVGVATVADNATVTTTTTAGSNLLSAGYLVALTGVGANSVVSGPGAGNNGYISAETPTVADVTP